jgi:transcriptional regulator GlxA family with amidase domain
MNRKPIDVTVVLLEGGYASTAVAPVEVFQSAGQLWNWFQGQEQEPRFRVRVASIDGKPVKSATTLSIVPECAIADIDHTDIVILSASGWNVRERIAGKTKLLPWLRKWHDKGAYVAGICAGVALLAEAGLLDGKRATTHWGLAEQLRKLYPKVLWQSEQFVTEDQRLMCSGGVYAAVDLSLYLVEKYCGHEVALQCAKSLLLALPRDRQAGYAVVPLSRPHDDTTIKEIEDWLARHVGHEVSIDHLAERAGMGRRSFLRRFKAATGQMPGAYMQSLKVGAARELLERGASSIQAVSEKVGYDDLAFFRGVFKKHTGMTPGEYRSRFADMSFDRGQLLGGELA